MDLFNKLLFFIKIDFDILYWSLLLIDLVLNTLTNQNGYQHHYRDEIY